MSLNVNYEQLLEAQKDTSILIVDVREPAEIKETGKLPGSIHIPMNDVQNIFVNLSEEEFEKRYGKQKPGKDTKIIFSCRSGKRSRTVQEMIQKLGYTKYANYFFLNHADYIDYIKIFICLSTGCIIIPEVGRSGKPSRKKNK
ncbi:hypothetical protein ACFW04_009757 [Cataglyphis niger]